MNRTTDSNDPQEILTQAIEAMKAELGDKFDLEKINLAELGKATIRERSKRLSQSTRRLQP